MTRLVDPLDLTLVLPMRLGTGNGPDPREHPFDRLDAALSKTSWIPIDPLVRGASEVEQGYVYAELAYFHPHVREFLYGNGYPDPVGETASAVHVYRHSKLDPGYLLVKQSKGEIKFAVFDVFLHHVRPDALLLSVHLSAAEPVEWQDALDAISFLRTISFQHYSTIPKKDESGAERFVWDGSGGEYLNGLRLTASPERKVVYDRAEELKASIRTREPKPLAVWDDLLSPLRAEGLELKLLGDHRMATMVFAGVADPEQISEDDWFALSQADSASYTPYAPAFRDEELRKAAYDRWWDKSAGAGKLKHRYLASPMTFLSITRWPPAPRPDYLERMRTTWRRQNFQTFLLAHYQRAALLILEQRIAALASEIEPCGSLRVEPALAHRIEELQGDIAKFSSGHWFPEISPQIQGQELYQLLRRHLCLDSLHESVVEDKSLLGNWVEAVEAIRRDRLLEQINEKYLPWVLIVAALGAGVITEPLKNLICSLLAGFGFWKAVSAEGQSLAAGGIVLALFCLIILPFWRWLVRR